MTGYILYQNPELLQKPVEWATGAAALGSNLWDKAKDKVGGLLQRNGLTKPPFDPSKPYEPADNGN
jgi:hypothetical protein